ncbi:tetratricopeptide repeat protein [Parafilimonas terrae]|uniref:Tetratricopeptide repeat-containing protein n=1 Tax=Parafilimonas terrae TaxID=1465490 RepID=A0A1I5Y1S7_9BACT|nr:tetratricopeptide repeat protein [Parafilimonas terrae]SFQ38145.1 Tetratricopeptide repeat-containing protein [Parafilimonas terrae]
MKRIILLSLVLFSAAIVAAQGISRHDADSMLVKLSKAKTDIERIDLMAGIAQFYILKPGENQIDFDSAEVYLKKAEALNARIKSADATGYLLLVRAGMIKEKGQSDKAKKMLEDAIDILKSGTNKSYLGQAYFALSWYYNYADSTELPIRLELVNQSVVAFQQANDLKRKGRSLEMLGDLNVNMQNYSKAVEILNQALAAYNAAKYENVQGVYVLLGIAYRWLGNNGQALSNTLKALKIAQQLHDSSTQVCQIATNLGSVYRSIGRIPMAINYYKMSLEIAQKNKDEYDIYATASILAQMYINKGQPDEGAKMMNLIPASFLSYPNISDQVSVCVTYVSLYLNLKQYDKAWRYCEELLQRVDDPMLWNTLRTWSYRAVATYYLKTHQLPKARNYLVKAEKIDSSIKFETGLILNLQLRYKLDSAEGNIPSAFRYLLLYKQKNDSVSVTKMEKQLEVISMEYEIEMKEDSIRAKDNDISFLRQKANLQQANLRQASLIKNITIGGIILALAVIILLYRQYRHKQKSNELLLYCKRKRLMEAIKNCSG